MILGADGAVGMVIELRDHAAKKRSGRLIPLHKDLRDALVSWRGIAAGRGPVVVSERGRAMTPLSIVAWFARAYRTIGLEACSSHSGRRTSVTRPPSLAHKAAAPVPTLTL